MGSADGPNVPLPEAVDLRGMGLDGPVKDQGAVGACTAFSLSTVMDSAVRKLGYDDTISALHVWSNYGAPYMGIAGDRNLDGMLTVDDVWPYDGAKACQFMTEEEDNCDRAYRVERGSAKYDAALMQEKARADSLGKYRLDMVEQFPSPHNPDEMAAVLAGGDAIWIAFSIDTAAWKPDKDAVIQDYYSTQRAGHAVALIGYRAHGDGRQFLIHNSWGPTWGHGGYAWISDDMIRRHTRSAYKLRVSDGSTPQPGANGCPQGQAPDVVIGRCANLCASGSPPAAGVCLPAIPGFPMPGQPSQPHQPGQPASVCPQGQGIDPMTRQCVNLCPNGYPSIGNMCLPGWGR